MYARKYPLLCEKVPYFENAEYVVGTAYTHLSGDNTSRRTLYTGAGTFFLIIVYVEMKNEWQDARNRFPL